MKAVCVYVDGGKGHYVPAKAVATELEKLGYEVAMEEFFDYLDIRWMGRINKIFWRTMLRYPSIEQHISKHNDADSNGMEMAIKFANKHCWRMLSANLEEFRPDFFFATHPYASTIISELLDHMGIDIPVYYYATDVFSAPVATICPKLKKFFISTEEGRDTVVKMGQDPSTVEIVPFPLQQSVAEAGNLTKEEARRRIGIDENLFTVQINLGGEGIGSLNLFHSLIKKDLPMQLVLIGGLEKKQEERLREIEEKSKDKNTRVYIRGYVNNVNDYMAASDIIAGRAGINTILEAIYMHRPFLITELVYTVLASADYVVKHGVGWDASEDKDKAFEIVLEAYNNPEMLKAMDAAFSRVPIEFSAKAVAERLMQG